MDGGGVDVPQLQPGPFALRALAGEPLRYLGILGPRKCTLQLPAHAGADETALANPLHSPVGLDIGADGPQQVALSIIAEIQATLTVQVRRSPKGARRFYSFTQRKRVGALYRSLDCVR